MTTQELHIEIDLLLQKINSHWTQNLLPQEKDLFINREITRFINRHIDRLGNKKRTGIFDTIKRTTELAPLLKTRSLPVIYDTIKKEAKVLLPFDYLYYVSSEVSCCCSCVNAELETKGYYTAEISPLKSINNFPLVINQGLYRFTIEPSDIPSDYLIEDNIPAYKNNIMLTNALNLLLEQKNTLDLEVKYNKQTNKFEFRSSSHFSIHYTDASGLRPVLTTLNSYKGYKALKDSSFSTVDVIDEEFSRDIKSSYLSGAKDEKSLVILRDKELFYTFKGVIADYVNLTYLKKPKKIDLLLQSNSELSDSTLEEILSDTAQRIMAIIGSDNYAKYVEEHSIIE